MISYFPHESPDSSLLEFRFNMTGNKFRFNYAEAANYFGVSKTTIRRWRSQQKLPPYARELLLIEYRGMPLRDGWERFYFHKGVLYTPYDKFNFTPHELLATWYLINAPETQKSPYWDLYCKAASGSLYGVRV